MTTPRPRLRSSVIIATSLALWFGAMYMFFGRITVRDLIIGPLALAAVWFLAPRLRQ